MAKLGGEAPDLRSIREVFGLTREQLALRAGISTSTVTRMELNGHIPSGMALIAISRALEISLDSLVHSIKTPQSSPAVQLSPQAEPAGDSFITEGAA